MDDGRDSLVVGAIDAKPHKIYIRYLLVQRYSPSKIKKDLIALGLSAPHENALERYYYLVIEPIVKRHKLGFLYAPYKEAIQNKGTKKYSNRFSMVINYKKDIMNDPDLEIRFLRLISDLNIIEAFGPDLIRQYGKLENVPNDPETGKSFVEHLTRYKEMPWEIVESPYRHIIEELLLEGSDYTGIIAYMDKNYNTRIRMSSLNLYSKIFFSVDRFDRNNQLKTLLAERENLFHEIRKIDAALGQIDTGTYSGDSGIPELLQEKKTLYSRVTGLDETIKSIQTVMTDIGIGQQRADNSSYAEMFDTMIQTTYSKFQQFSKMNDRGIVEPLYKLTKMMQNNYDMLQKAKADDIKGAGHAQAELIRMVNQREQEAMEEDIKAYEGFGGFDPSNFIKNSGIDPRLIEGVEELIRKEEDEDADEE